MDPRKLSKPELLKLQSEHLRGELARELDDPEINKLSGDSENLVKFHGMYQQKNRDSLPAERTHVLMIRGRIPGGRLSAKQWLVWDQLATEFGAGGLRITTRQGLQLHGILIRDAKAVAKKLHDVLATTSGACGDVVRNVTQAINPWGDSRLKQLDPVVDKLSSHFQVKSKAYSEVFLDGEAVSEKETETIYGETYLPRKFKIAVTLAGNNSVDLYTNDLGFAASLNGEGKIDGYFVFAGGGMGMTHNRPETFPRLADYLGWIEKEALIPVAEAAVTTQRDFGDRENRKHARLKYTIADRGVKWFKSEVENRSGHKFLEKELPSWNTPNYLGWHSYKDKVSLGFHAPSGRINGRLRKAIREIVERYKPEIQLTTDQDLVLIGLERSAKEAISKSLVTQGINPHTTTPLYDRALACVALPMCGKALAEGERAYPDVLSKIQVALDKHKLSHRAPIVRITGCPNGCARPYSAEIALVGQAPDKYAIYVGGNREGTRLASRIKEKVPSAELFTLFDRLFGFWAALGRPGEYFGDFSNRWSPETLLEEIEEDSITTPAADPGIGVHP